jgi:putative transposase
MQLFQPLLALIASASDSILAQQLSYAQAELKIMRAHLPKRIVVTPEERAILLKHGRPLGRAIETIITLVSASTFRRWARDEDRRDTRGQPASKTGRRRKPFELRQLVCRIARETGMGYGRILGELRRLGILSDSRQTVRNILKEEGIPTGPQRSHTSWTEFLSRHAQTLYACDFFTKSVVTPRGLVEMYLLVVIHWNTREIWVSPATAQPDSAWVAQQARNFLLHAADRGLQPTHLIRDRDAKFTAPFDGIWTGHRAEVIKLPARQPILNSRCERVIQTLQVELLRQFIAFGERHLNYLVQTYVAYYNQRRAHSSREYFPPQSAHRPAPNDSADPAQILGQEQLGGVIRWYERRAA